MQALLTDLGKVVLTFWERAEVLRRIVKAFGGNLESVNKIFPEGETGEHLYDELDRGVLSLEDFHKKICELTSIDLTFDRFIVLWRAHLQIIQPVADFYRSIQERFPIIAVTNGDGRGRYATDLLRVYGEIRFFKVFSSSAYGMKKPELFAEVRKFLEETGFDLKQCPFVDDIPRYVSAAGEYGIPGILFDGSKQSVEVLKVELAKFGIE